MVLVPVVFGERLYGKVDDVPNLFCVRTSFLHMYFVPFFPEASYLVLYQETIEEKPKCIRIPISWKSVFMVWFKIIDGMVLAIAASAAVALTVSWRPIPWVVILILALIAILGAALYALTQRLQKPSRKRMLQLATILGLDEAQLDWRYSNKDYQWHDLMRKPTWRPHGLRIYPHRVLYYWSILHCGQLTAGDDYAKLQATISISFVNAILFPQVPDYHLHFQLREAEHSGLIFSPQLSIHVVELPKFNLKVEELKDPLDLWIYFLIHGSELDKDALPEPLRKSPVQQAMEVLSMMAQTEAERERYESRVKAERDQRARELQFAEDREIATKAATAQGMAQGMAQGIAQGVAQGDVIGRIHLCQRLLRSVETPRDELLAKSIDELRALAAALEQQLAQTKLS